MLHLALYVPKGQPPFPRDILIEPDIACYVQGWGRPAIGDWWHVKGKSKLAPSGCAYGRMMKKAMGMSAQPFRNYRMHSCRNIATKAWGRT